MPFRQHHHEFQLVGKLWLACNHSNSSSQNYGKVLRGMLESYSALLRDLLECLFKYVNFSCRTTDEVAG